jgi:uncharacterized protein YbjT (DUF2867 family)
MKFNLFGTKKVGKVLILDGDNVIGYRIVNLIIEEGEFPGVELRVGFREMPAPDEVNESWDCVERVKFVWEDEDTYADALKGVTTVFVSTPTSPGFDKHFKSFVAAFKKARVERVIKLSWYHAIRSRAEEPTKYFGDPDYLLSEDAFHDVPLVHQHALCDGDLILGGVDCTILFASHLMSNVLEYQSTSLKEEQQFYGASKGKGVNYVSPNDVADIAVRAILDRKTHRREGYTLTGPSPITDLDVATLLSAHLKTDITYIEQPLTSFTKTSAALEAIKASGIEEDNKFLKGDFERLTGRKPEAFGDYLMRENAMAPCEKKALGHTLTMTSKLEKEFPEDKHTLTMMPKIEADFPEEPHFITLLPKTEQ